MPHNLSMRRILPFIIAALVLAVVLFLVLRPKPVAVDILTLAAADMQTSVVASGRVLPPAKVEIGATITARVEKVQVREGARIVADQVLVELERGEWAAAAAQARAAVARRAVGSRGGARLRVGRLVWLCRAGGHAPRYRYPAQ